ncbi:MAG: thermonuclease family protein [Pirellula sp.]|jgi:micrococcal nuclease
MNKNLILSTKIFNAIVLGMICQSATWSQSTSESKSKSNTKSESKEEQTMEGKTKKVIDGDSLIVVDEEGKESEIQLDGIDAPEFKQAFGKDATKVLEKLVANKKVTVKWTAKDNYDRILGKVYVDETFVNLEMLKKGAAWHFKRYNKDETLAKAEDEAKSEKLGLWKDDAPESPWDYRKNNRSKD